MVQEECVDVVIETAWAHSSEEGGKERDCGKCRGKNGKKGFFLVICGCFWFC